MHMNFNRKSKTVSELEDQEKRLSIDLIEDERNHQTLELPAELQEISQTDVVNLFESCDQTDQHLLTEMDERWVRIHSNQYCRSY